jgi:hypothetical protein
MTRAVISDELKRRLLYSEFARDDPVSLRIDVERITPRRGKPHDAEIAVVLVDSKGVVLCTACRMTMAEGNTLTLADLSRAWDLHLS